MSQVDDELLFSANPRDNNFGERLLFYVYAFGVALLPTYLYVTIFGLPFGDYLPVFAIVSVIAGLLLAVSYQNLARNLMQRLSMERYEPQIRRDVKKEDRLALRDELKATHVSLLRQESVAFALLFCNLLYLFFTLLLAFYVLKTLPALYNYSLSITLAAAIAFVSSTGK